MKLLKWPSLLKYVRNSSRIYLFVFLLTLIGCSNIVLHGFEFNAIWDSPGIRILDYRYGTSKHPGARPTKEQIESGKTPQQVRIFGDMRRGDELYVKWKDITANKIYEDTVDLKKLLPQHITRHDLRFIVRGSKLNVYLISPYKLDKNNCPANEERKSLIYSENPDNKILLLYCYYKILKIYPEYSEIKSYFEK